MTQTIYKISCKDASVPHSYIGSSKNYEVRPYFHISASYIKPHIALYKCIAENGGWENWEFQVLETYENIQKAEILRKEGEYIRSQSNPLNMRIAGRTFAEYLEDNKERLAKYNKEIITCECGAKITRQGRFQHRKTKKHIAYVPPVD